MRFAIAAAPILIAETLVPMLLPRLVMIIVFHRALAISLDWMEMTMTVLPVRVCHNKFRTASPLLFCKTDPHIWINVIRKLSKVENDRGYRKDRATTELLRSQTPPITIFGKPIYGGYQGFLKVDSFLNCKAPSNVMLSVAKHLFHRMETLRRPIGLLRVT